MSDRRNVLKPFEQQKDFINEKVNSNIEKFRKGDGKITFIDKFGKPLKNAKIKLNQKLTSVLHEESMQTEFT